MTSLELILYDKVKHININNLKNVTVMKKREKSRLLTIVLAAVSIFAFSNLQGQTLSFSSSRDTIYQNESITFMNQSTGFSQFDQFGWKIDSCKFISLAPKVSSMYFTNPIDSLNGYVTNAYSNRITITLTAYDSIGNQLGTSGFSKTIVVLPAPMTMPWPVDSCHQPIDTCTELICNGSFNWLSDTITNSGEVHKAQPWNQTSSADLFSYYGTPSWLVGVPTNYFGVQADHSNQNGLGNYAGIISYWTASIYWREYITQELQSTLIVNQRYELNLFLNLGDTSGLATNGVQVLFTDTSIANQLNAYIISPTTNNMLDLLGNTTMQDTANWVNFNMVYTPNQPGQRFISIGNFKPDSLLIIDTICPTCINGIGQWAYYFVDDISLSPIPPTMNISSNMAANTICLAGDTIVLYANAIGDSTLLWSTGSTADSIMVAPLTDTFYTVTATDYTRCHSFTDTVWVYVSQSTAKPNVWLNDAYGCGDLDTVQLHVQGTGSISYLWSTGDTTALISVVSNGQTQNYSVTVSGTYPPCNDTTLYATVYSSLSVSAPVVTGNVNTCDTLLTYRIHNYNPLLHYSWSYDNVNYQAINDSIFAINCNTFPQLFGGDTLIFKTHDTICNQIAISQFPLLSCCIYPDIQLFLNHGDTLDINHSHYNASNQRIEFNNLRMSINDTVYIDVNTQFYDCAIDMGPYATIMFRNGDNLIIENTEIGPCDTILWNSVILPKSTQHLHLKDCIINGAITAFNIERGASSYIDGNSFIENYVSVRIYNYNPSIPNPLPIGGYLIPPTYNGVFIKNSIIGTSTTLLFPYQTKKSHSGLELKDVYGFKAGTSTNQSQTNSFKNLEYGIFGIHSEFEVYYSNFEDINPTSMSSGIWAGGTYCFSGAIVSFNPLSNTLPSNPPLSYTSALTTSVRAYNNSITNSSLGIYGGSSRLDLRYNTIQAKHNGIVAHEPSFDSHIRGNTIDVETYLRTSMQTEYTGVGILANNVLEKLTKLNISDNTINDPPKTGIWIENLNSIPWQVNNVYRTVVGNNTVNFNTEVNQETNWEHYGLRISNCDRAIVGFNQVINYSSMHPYYWEAQKAISVRDCKDARVYSNYPITNMATGIHVIGNNINTQFYCNSITDFYNGFYFEYGSGVATYISDQGNTDWATDNVWNDGTQMNLRMAGKNNLDPAQVPQLPNSWYFRGNGGADMQSFNPQIPSNTPFNYTLFGMPGNSSPSICPMPSVNPLDPGGAMSYEAMREEYYGEIMREEINFEILADEFGYFNDEYFFEEMDEYSDWLSLGTPDDVAYQALFTYLLNSNIGEFSEVINLMENGNIDEAINQNNGIIPGNIIEVNEQYVNEMYLTYYLDDNTPSDNELQTLESIALLTPWIGGEAVYTARILLGIDPDRHGIAYRLQNGDSIINTDSGIKIYPNPTTGNITIEFDNEPNDYIVVQVNDLSGKEIFADKLNPAVQVNVELGDISIGAYVLKVSDANGLIETRLLIIN
jgi:hypothetical protein